MGTGAARTPREWLLQPWAEWVAVLGLVAVAFVLRYLFLFHGGYPPSQDASGDLYNTRLWLDGVFQGPHSALLFPPVYYFVVVVPLTAVFPVFTAVNLMIALVPALMVVPAYFLLRRVGVLRLVALPVSFLLALSPAYSSLVTWNSAYNMFAIVLLVAFFYFLLGYLDDPRRRNAIVAAVFFSLVLGSHELTAVVLVVAVIAFFAFVAVEAAARRQLKPLLTVMGRFTGWAALFTVPWWPVYVYSEVHVTNVGYAGSQVNWSAYLQTAFVYPWNAGTVTGAQTLVGFDVAVVLVALGALVVSYRRHLRFSLLLAALFVASMSVVLLDTENASRGLMFPPIVVTLALAPPISDAVSALLQRRSVATVPASRAVLPRWRRLVRPPRGAFTGAVAVSIVAVVLFTYANTENSLSVFQSSREFYSVIDSDSLSVIDYLGEHGAPGSTAYVPGPLLGWVQYFDSGINVVGPYPLAQYVVTNGLSQVQMANQAYTGSYTLGDRYLGVSMNYPGTGQPLLWVGSPGYTTFLGSTVAGSVHVINTSSEATEALPFAAAGLASASSSLVANASGVSATYRWSWAASGVVLDETTWLLGESVEVRWASMTPGYDIQSVSYLIDLPQNGLYYWYDSFLTLSGSAVAVDRFSYSVGYGVNLGFTLSVDPLGGGSVSQEVQSNGSGAINVTTEATLDLNLSGLLAYPDTAGTYFANATTLLHALGVNYVVVNSETDPTFFSYLWRSQSGGSPATGLRSTLDYESGPWYLFGVTYA